MPEADEEHESETAGYVGAHEQVMGAPTDWLSLNTAPAKPGAEANAVAAKAEPPGVFVPAREVNVEGEILDVDPTLERRAEERAEDARDPRRALDDTVEADLDGRND